MWNKYNDVGPKSTANTLTGLTSPSFCTRTSEKVYITDRTGFLVPTLGRVSGCL
jgi:hypothetical protein